MKIASRGAGMLDQSFVKHVLPHASFPVHVFRTSAMLRQPYVNRAKPIFHEASPCRIIIPSYQREAGNRQVSVPLPGVHGANGNDMASLRRAVITGIGVITPLGLDTTSFWDGLRLGRSGVRRLESFDSTQMPVHIGAEIPGFDARNYLEKKERKRLGIMVRTFQFVVAAAQVALEDGLVDKQKIDPRRFGTLVGSATIPGNLSDLGPATHAAAFGKSAEEYLSNWGQILSLIPPLWMLTHIPNMMGSHVSILHNAQGPNNTIIESDVAGLLAVGEAYQYVRRDRADIVLVGSADCNTCPANFMRHCLFDELSHRSEAPEKACRPFDRDRDGLVLGEGGGVILVEELEHARRRGARIYAEIAGFASGFDRGCIGPGLARTVRGALTQAGVAPNDIDHINAHGISTVGGDAFEARGLAEIFGKTRPAFAPKSGLGHMGAACGTVELAASLLAQQHGLVPGTLNYDNPAPDCPIRVCRDNRQMETPNFLKVSYTEMGQCAAAVCRKWDSFSA